eukprot:g167.t1
MTSPKDAQKEMVNELKRPGSAGAASDNAQTALRSQVEKEMNQDQKSVKEQWGRKAAAMRFNSELSRQGHPGKLDHYHAHVNPNAFHTPKQNGFRFGAEK